ncbi:hypothetical protein GF325_16270 [Candidatus Bathyarchaeota archaeon]|nr:hypothetical protein [Candidatus Bathyarchaeota archaeon]
MTDSTKKLVLVPETHWDREWYLPFQEYRAKLVQMLDRLLTIFAKNPQYVNFTLDGQTIPLEDYLEVRPGKRDELQEAISSKRLSIGPFYILPDEFLVSGESMIRNLLLGRKIAQSFGVEPMKAGYIPDPFGHFAQMPQILAGFGIPSIIFSRGFDDSFEQLGLDMEFRWDAPGNAASIIGIHLVKHYGNCARLSTIKDQTTGNFEQALRRMYQVATEINEHTVTDAILLNNGTDHTFAQPEIPDMVAQWNEKHGDDFGRMIQADFEHYTNLVLEDIDKKNLHLKHFQGELHGGRYQNLLSGVFSARMWIKQWNKVCEQRLSRYAEPLSTIAWIHGCGKPGKNGTLVDDREYLWTGWKWLLKNHPHDSICGCSIDHVHDVDMRTRFGWAEQVATEIFKNASLDICKSMEMDTRDGERFPILVFNPCPRARSMLVTIPVFLDKNMLEVFPPGTTQVEDMDGNPVYSFTSECDMEDRYMHVNDVIHSINFLARNIPGLGWKVFFLVPGEEPVVTLENLKNKVKSSAISGSIPDGGWIENEFYKVTMHGDGTFDVLDKDTGVLYQRQGMLEDVGDWGDEYDFSGPGDGQEDITILSVGHVRDVEIVNHGNIASLRASYVLPIPVSLAEDRSCRSSDTVPCPAGVTVTIDAATKMIHVDVTVENNAMDHRLRMRFNSGLMADAVDAEGHFHVIQRPVDLPEGENWHQPPVPTKHQDMFVSVSDGSNCFTVMNFGLPEYAPSRAPADGSVSLAITLFRSVGWLSRGDIATRKGNAGPDLSTPGAQCLGVHECFLGITTGSGDWFTSKSHLTADEFINPIQVISPLSLAQSMRMIDAFILGVNLSLEGSISDPLPAMHANCELENADAFLLTAFKRAENQDNACIIRLINMAGDPRDGTIHLGKPVASAAVVNLAENTPSDEVKAEIINVNGNSITFRAGAHVILTMMVSFE